MGGRRTLVQGNLTVFFFEKVFLVLCAAIEPVSRKAHNEQAKVTDLLAESKKYLVIFLEYNNTQVCTGADLAPLDTVVTKAAPAPLEFDATEQDPLVLEAERQARIAQRQLQLKAEEEERLRILQEKRQAVVDKRAKLEALDREEKARQVAEQRSKLEAATPAPIAGVLAVVASSTPVTPASSAQSKQRERRLAMMGGSSAKKMSLSLADLKEVARNSPQYEPAAQIENLNVLANPKSRALDFDSPPIGAPEESSSGDDLEEEASESMTPDRLMALRKNADIQIIPQSGEDTMVAMDALRDLANAESSYNNDASTTQILQDLQDEFPDDLIQDLKDARDRENEEVDAMLQGLSMLQGESSRAGFQAATDLDDLEADARRLLEE